MSRCAACDKVLSIYEMKRKHKVTGEYLDLCSDCLRFIEEVQPIPHTGPKFEEQEDDNEFSA